MRAKYETATGDCVWCYGTVYKITEVFKVTDSETGEETEEERTYYQCGRCGSEQELE